MEAGRVKLHAGQGELALDIPAESDPLAQLRQPACQEVEARAFASPPVPDPPRASRGMLDSSSCTSRGGCSGPGSSRLATAVSPACPSPLDRPSDSSMTALPEGPLALDARPSRPERGVSSHPHARFGPQTSATTPAELTYRPHVRSRLGQIRKESKAWVVECSDHQAPVEEPIKLFATRFRQQSAAVAGRQIA